jgi:flagellar assembly protein FliH
MHTCSRIVRSASLAAPLTLPATARPGQGVQRAGGAAVAPSTAETEQARLEAQRLLAQAKVEAVRIREEARAAGLREGREQGRLEARSTLGEQVVELQSICTVALDERQRLLERTEADMVALSLAVAAHICRLQGAIDSRLAEEAVRAALKRVGNEGNARVRLNPVNLATVEAAVNDPHASESQRNVQFLPDPAVTPGGCLVEVTAGTVDATLEGQFAETVRYFQSLLEGD